MAQVTLAHAMTDNDMFHKVMIMGENTRTHSIITKYVFFLILRASPHGGLINIKTSNNNTDKMNLK